MRRTQSKEFSDGGFCTAIYGELQTETIREALDLLVSKGWMRKRETIASKIIYTMNKERAHEIRTFVSEFKKKRRGVNTFPSSHC